LRHPVGGVHDVSRKPGLSARGASKYPSDKASHLSLIGETVKRLMLRDPRGTNPTMLPMQELNTGSRCRPSAWVSARPPEETRDAVRAALGTGYRHIDPASPYGNERQVGEGVHSADIEYGGHASDGGRTTATTDGELDRSKR